MAQNWFQQQDADWFAQQEIDAQQEELTKRVNPLLTQSQTETKGEFRPIGRSNPGIYLAPKLLDAYQRLQARIQNSPYLQQIADDIARREQEQPKIDRTRILGKPLYTGRAGPLLAWLADPNTTLETPTLPEMQHPEDESRAGYWARGIYNQGIRPFSSIASMMLAGIGVPKGGPIFKPRGITGVQQSLPFQGPIEGAIESALQPRLPLETAPEQTALQVGRRPPQRIFYSGEAGTGIGRYPVNMRPDYPRVGQTTQLNRASSGQFESLPVTVLPRETEGITQIPAELAAERGTAIGRPAIANEEERLLSRIEELTDQMETYTGRGKPPILPSAKITPGRTLPTIPERTAKIPYPSVSDIAQPELRQLPFEPRQPDFGFKGIWEPRNVPYRTGGTQLFGQVTQKIPSLAAARAAGEQPETRENKLARLLGIPRALKAAGDFSAPFRQALPLIHRKEFWEAMPDMFRAWASPQGYKDLMEEITANPEFSILRDGGLALTGLAEKTAGREEPFMSNLIEKVPILGKFVRMSDQAYVGFLNKVRMDVGASMVRQAREAGVELTPQHVKAIANFVNDATGRGNLGSLEGHAQIFNALFFSPRLASSRLRMLNRYMNPVMYVKATPEVRKETLKSLFALAGMGTTAITLAKLAGADVEADPRSVDFGKIRTGNVRTDIWGGFQPYVRTAAQLVSGQTKTQTGEIIDLGSKFGRPTRLDAFLRFLEQKESPVAAFVTDVMRGPSLTEPVTLGGSRTTLPAEIVQLFAPMVMSDIYDVMKENPALLPLSIPDAFGIGVQVYGKTPSAAPFGRK